MKHIKLGLIGKTLKHSFSKKYFDDKFKIDKNKSVYSAKNIMFSYNLFELKHIDKVNKLLNDKDFLGFNITIPYKQDIIPFLTDFQKHAKEIGAVNVVSIERNNNGMAKKIIGYNTDFIGFSNTLKEWIPHNYKNSNMKALVLGTGGASKAIKYALLQMNIPYLSVSRTKKYKIKNINDIITYEQMFEQPEILEQHKLIINTTPLGTYPDNHLKPNIPYKNISTHHYLYDLVYNPKVTSFLQEGINKGAYTLNGYNMLVGQAVASWEIWQKYL